MAPHLQATAREYKLFEWVDKVDKRRRRYFLGIDDFKRLCLGVAEREPKEEKIIRYLVLAIEDDKTFTGHLMRWKNSSKLTEAAFWTDICTATAEIILERYLQACAENQWPAAV
jgi:hypothetical protein